MHVSEHFSLGKSQAMLDFVDVRHDTDIPLFVDPFAISIRKDELSDRCNDLIVSFFESLLNALRSNDNTKAQSLLSKLTEPNETHLGLSRDKSAGRGVGPKQASQLIKAFKKSAAFKSGQLEDLSESTLFIHGIGSDKISDITTNIIRGALIEYTQQQCDLHSIPTSTISAGFCWDIENERWESVYQSLPLIDNYPVLLTPKYLVRRSISLNTQEFYNHHMLSYLQQEHLSSNSALVEVLKNGRRRVTKTKLKEHYPFDKDQIFDFVNKNPHVLEIYKKVKGAEGSLTNSELQEDFREDEFSAALKLSLSKIPSGSENAHEYHEFMMGIISFLFYPYLVFPVKEKPINDGRKRIDISYTNAARSGFFENMSQNDSFNANFVPFECKNYSSDIGNPEIDQLAMRFSDQRGRLGFLLHRKFSDKTKLVRHCADVARAGNGCVIAFDDNDIVEMLSAIERGQRRTLDQFLFRRLQEVHS